MTIFQNLDSADYIVVNNQLAVPAYRCASEDCADEDDIALECRIGSLSLTMTVADFEDAEPMADGGYWIEGIGCVRFLTRRGLH